MRYVKLLSALVAFFVFSSASSSAAEPRDRDEQFLARCG